MAQRRKHSGARRAAWLLAALALGLAALPGTTRALVSPVSLIQRQVVKPNMLILFDTSTSMMNSPGDKDLDSNEVGQDCDAGDDQCRMVGTPGRCFYAGTGAMGAGVKSDDTSCHVDAECRVGYCKNSARLSCDQASDCGAGNSCDGFCDNDNSIGCNSDAACGTGKCRGVCSNSNPPLCTSDADCAGPGNYCSVYPNDFCVTASGTPAKSRVCVAGQNRCRTDSDCSAYPGDTCGPASSRMVVAKRVISSIVSSYYSTVNFGLMTFYQEGYYPYYPISGAVTTQTVTRYVDRDKLRAFNCWNKKDGPSGTCTFDGQIHTLRATDDSRYRIKTGPASYTTVDVNWCGSSWCPLPANGGTGYYQGSYYTYSSPSGTIGAGAPIIQTSYQGKSMVSGGTTYMYWDAPKELRNANNVFGVNGGTDPISAGDPGPSVCCATCGGRADATVAPFMDTSNDPIRARDMAHAIMAKMEKAGLGGVAADGFTPTGCALSFGGSSDATTTNNALSYMQTVRSSDPLSCRNNYVLLVTDGSPNRGYDLACNSAACAAADPTAAGCTCLAVKSAQALAAAGVKTYVVGFSGATTDPYTSATLNNIARAGGTNAALFAVREADLRTAIVNAIYEAAQGSYSTSPATSSAGTQTTSGIALGTMVIDSRVDFPGWKGQLIAYETSSGTPTVAWSAATVSFNAAVDPNFWKKRNVWTSNGTTMVKIDVDLATGAINNKAVLRGLGLGATDDEAERVARWLLGDPAMNNPAVLGAIINSTPIDIGPPGDSPLPGGNAFHLAHANRPFLTYVGSSDGMLHAFFSKSVTVGGQSYVGGQEAFAYIPQSMLAVANKLYAQGGQLPDPKDHVYGLANSPKVKNMCTANCDGASGTPVWKTALVMAYGFGGTEAFVLDITNPFDGSGVKTSSAPASLMWHTQYGTPTSTSAYDNELGLTTSVPAFYYAKGTSKDDFRLVFGSYFTDGATGSVGKTVINASAQTGAIVHSLPIAPAGSCAQALGLLSDVATARNFSATEEVQIHAAYFGDTWGNLYRYVPTVSANNYTGTTGSLSVVEALGCQQPVHYAPAVVQLDRENPHNRPGEIYLVQVTNSALDDETAGYPASRMIVRRDLATAPGTVGDDATFTPIVLRAGVASELCGVTNAAGTSCVEALPTTARPNATPMAVLRKDGTGFQVISTWYLPASDSCTDGATYLTIHDFTVAGGMVQKFGMKLASEPVTSAVFAGGKLMFVKQSGVTDLSGMLPPGVSYGQPAGGGTPGANERLRVLGWNELP
jgi:hypothetical protein